MDASPWGQATLIREAVSVIGDNLALSLACGFDPIVLPLLRRAIFQPQAMPAAVAGVFPFEPAVGPGHMSVEGEDGTVVWPALTRAVMAYPFCRVPVRILGGTADLVVNDALHGSSAAQTMPKARFEWVPGLAHRLHHFTDETVVDVIDGLRSAQLSHAPGFMRLRREASQASISSRCARLSRSPIPPEGIDQA